MMGTVTLTLTDFLTARLDEDEAVAREAIAQRNAEIARGVYVSGREPTPDPRGPMVWDDWTGGPGIRAGAEWLLAEVAAKRLCLDLSGTHITLWPILRILASVYADHPDFRDEWRG